MHQTRKQKKPYQTLENIQTHLPVEELFYVPTVGLGVGGDVDGAGGRLLHPHLHSSEDLPKIRETHGGGEG